MRFASMFLFIKEEEEKGAHYSFQQVISFLRSYSEEKKHENIFDNDKLEQAQRDHHQIPGHFLVNIIRQNFFHSFIYVIQ